MQLQIQPESNLLNVVATGEFSLDEAKRTFVQLLEASALHNCKKVLFDGRTLTGNPETIERFFYGAFAAQTVLASMKRGVATQFAYVLREPMFDRSRFGETVAVNRGMNVKVTDNAQEALQWLGGEF